MVKKGALPLAGAYVLLCLGLYLGQDYFIFSGRRTHGRSDSTIQLPDGAELVTLRTASGGRVSALYGAALGPGGRSLPGSPSRRTLIFFYGNGSCLATSMDEFTHFRRLGVNVLIPDYPGYGMSDGGASEANCYAAAEAGYEYLRRVRGIEPDRIVAGGRSLGGAVAIYLAALRPVCGLVTFSTFTNMGDVARRRFPGVPVSLLLRSKFPSIARIHRIKCPVLFVHGVEDRLVPIASMDALAAASGGKSETLRIPGAGHDDLFAIGGDDLFAAVGRFFDSLDRVGLEGKGKREEGRG